MSDERPYRWIGYVLQSGVKCDCEASWCTGHEAGSCVTSARFEYNAFGHIQQLCTDCSKAMRDHYTDQEYAANVMRTRG